MHENLIQFLRQRHDAFPFRRDLDLRQFLTDAVGRGAELLPVPAKIFLLDELEPRGYGFPATKAPAMDELEARMQRWLAEELAERGTGKSKRKEDLLASYREHVLKLARNAAESSVLADYESVFWLLHTQQTARLFTAFVRQAIDAGLARDEAERLRWSLQQRWSMTVRERGPARGFLELVLDNPLISGELFVSPDLHELRGFATVVLRRDFSALRQAVESLRNRTIELLAHDRLLRRAISLLGYPDSAIPPLVMLFDPRVRQLLEEHSSFDVDVTLVDAIGRRLLEALLVLSLRRGIVLMKTTADGENVADDGTNATYSRAIRPMNFGRRGVVEPVVYRYGLVYDITSFTETLGEIARGGKGEEQTSYRQMIEFQRELADITRRHALQFEKFLGDGAFYTSRRATRTLHAAIDIQQFYASAREKGFAFNRGMRIALNYGYYRLLPMQIASDGTQIMEFYGPGIVELSRLTTGKTTKELEELQHLLLSHGYDQQEVYRFFAPLSRGVEHVDTTQQRREFYAYVNESGHLINEGVVVSIPFVRQLSTEVTEERQKLYRLRAPWSTYIGIPASSDGYIGLRLLGAVSLKGIGMQDIGEAVWLSANDADISVVDEEKALLQLLQQERNRTSARSVSIAANNGSDIAVSDLVVCAEQNGSTPMILVGEWDPISEEVRRPIRLDGTDAERYGLAVPLTMQNVESHSIAYQKLYRTLSRIETLPSFSADAIRHNANFSGFIIGATVEPL
ncbi:MAG TPA: hypothetical protein VHW00_17465 [Thermoanaerobaculia bacterium]|nr:hypothetical protein [Thermoanaerobaculia bacterium]